MKAHTEMQAAKILWEDWSLHLKAHFYEWLFDAVIMFVSVWVFLAIARAFLGAIGLQIEGEFPL